MQPTTAQRVALWIATLQAWAAVVGSLILSNVLSFPPCDLCWWQRIFFYPLAWIFPAALLRRDARGAVWYGLPLALAGWVLAFYQSLLQWGMLDANSIIPCSLNNPCAEKQINWFGFVTVPFLSFLGFSLVLVCLLVLMGNGRTAPAKKPLPVKKAPARRAVAKKKR